VILLEAQWVEWKKCNYNTVCVGANIQVCKRSNSVEHGGGDAENGNARSAKKATAQWNRNHM